MKEILKHRIDALMEKAIAGDADAQLQLAKEFVRGKYVEKSQDNARYWAFKAINGGNYSAQTFYYDLYFSHTKSNYSLKNILSKALQKLVFFPTLELILGFVGLIFVPDESIFYTVSCCLFLIGIVTLILIGWLGEKIESFFSDYATEKSIGIIMIVTHIVALCIAII